jgi:hypothetical protein
MLALLACETDRLVDAQSLFEAVSVPQLVAMPVDNLWLRTLTDWAAVCSYLGDAATATALHGILTAYADQYVAMAAAVSGSVSHYLGMLAATFRDFEEADARFATAAAMHDKVGFPTWLARTQYEHARMLLASGRRGDARFLLEKSLAAARELGLRTLERRAAGLLSPSA